MRWRCCRRRRIRRLCAHILNSATLVLSLQTRGSPATTRLNAGVKKRYAGGFQYGVNYTWSKFIDNQESRNELANYNAGYSGTNDAFTDYYNPRDRFGLSGNDIRNRVIGSALYELPIGPGKWIHPSSFLVNEFVSGWTVGAISEIHSGTALGVLDSTNNTGTYSDGVRPNLVGNPNDLSRLASQGPEDT